MILECYRLIFVTFVYGNTRSSYRTAGFGIFKSLQIKECCLAGILCLAAQLLLDTKKLIILGNPVAAAGGAAFDLSCIQSNGQIRNSGILRPPDRWEMMAV